MPMSSFATARPIVVAAILLSASIAQSPLTTTFASTGTLPVGGTLYYDVQFSSTVTVTSTSVNLASPPGTVGTLDVFYSPLSRTGNQLNAAVWTLAGTATVTSQGRNVPTIVPVAPGSVFSAGTVFGFAIRANGLQLAYTAVPAPMTWSTAEMSLTAGEATAAAFTGPLLAGRAINTTIQYVPGILNRVGDECATAQPVGMGTQGPYGNGGYTTSAGLFSCTAAGNDRWFRFVPPETGVYSVDTCSGSVGDTVLQLQSDTCVGPLVFACNDNACGVGSSGNIHMPAGSAFLIRVGGKVVGGTPSGFSCNLTIRKLDDECSGAVTVGVGTTAPFANTGYTNSVPPMPCGSAGRDRWFRFVPPSTGPFDFHTCTAARTFDTVLEVLGGSCGGLTGLGCNDDTGNAACGANPSLASLVSLNLTAGVPVYVRVGGFNDAQGVAQLVIQPRSITADFSPTTTQSGTVPLTVAFTDLSTTSASSGITAWSWDFDNNGTVDSTQRNPTFTYTQAGTYSVRLTVSDLFGASAPRVRTGLVVANLLAGDECATATAVGVGTNGPFGTTGFTASSPAFPCAAATADRWFSFQVPGSGTSYYRIRTCTGALVGNTVLQVLTGGCGSANRACNDDFAALSCGNGSAVELSFTGGSTVLFRVGSIGGAATFEVVVEPIITAAAFTATPRSGVVPLTVAFSHQATTNAAGGIVAWAWDLDGVVGTDSTAANPAFSYVNPGRYDVRLTVTDALGQVATVLVPQYIDVLPLVGDECGTATALQVGDNGPFAASFYSASTTTWGTCANGQRDRWFTFTPPCPGAYTFTAGGRLLQLLTGTCAVPVPLVCGTSLHPQLAAGVPLFVRVGQLGAGTCTVRVERDGDSCPTADVANAGVQRVACNSGFTNSTPVCGSVMPDRWFRFVPTATSTHTIYTSYAAPVELLSGSCGSLTTLQCGSLVTQPLTQGVPCWIRVGLPSTADFDLFILPGKGSGTGSGLLIHEFVHDDQGTGEFVEIWNADPQPFPVAGCYLVAIDAQGTRTVAVVPATEPALAAGSPFVFGASALRNGQPGADFVTGASLPDGPCVLRLWSQNGLLLDTVSYESSSGSPAPSLHEGHPLYGAHRSSAANPTSWSRQRDGRDTGDNGLDFRIMPRTPGATNEFDDLRPWADDFEGGSVPRPVPAWGGCDELPQIVIPGTPPPSGTQCAEFPAGPPGEGRSYMFLTDASDNFQLAAWVWFDLPTGLPTGATHSWSIGLCGTTDARYAVPQPYRPLDPDVNGDTGLTWTYQVTSSGATLYLIDNGAGGDDELVIRSWPILSAGWRRLSLGVSGDGAIGSFDAAFTDVGGAPPDEVSGSVGKLYGGIYVGVHQALNTTPGTFTLRVDDALADTSARVEIGGPGCDGNCRDRNRQIKLLDRSEAWRPAQRRVALLIDQSASVGMIASQVCFFMAKAADNPAPAATVTALAAVPVLGGFVPGAPLSDPVVLQARDLGWYVGDIWQVNTSQTQPFSNAGPFFLDLQLNAGLQPPIALASGGGEDLVEYREWNANNSTWGPPLTAFWSVRWTCDGRYEVKAVGTTDLERTDLMPMVDLLVQDVPPAGLAALSALSLASVSPIPIPTTVCHLDVDPSAIVAILIGGPIVGGSSTASFVVPAVPLTGLQLQTQWFVLSPTFNPIGVVSSNRWGLYFR